MVEISPHINLILSSHSNLYPLNFLCFYFPIWFLLIFFNPIIELSLSSLNLQCFIIFQYDFVDLLYPIIELSLCFTYFKWMISYVWFSLHTFVTEWFLLFHYIIALVQLVPSSVFYITTHSNHNSKKDRPHCSPCIIGNCNE